MDSRNSILQAVRSNKPGQSLRADYTLPSSAPGSVEDYRLALEKNGGKFFSVAALPEVGRILAQLFPGAVRICSMVEEFMGTRNLSSYQDPHELADIDVAVIRGSIGVAENAAVWVPEKNIAQRVLPFIAQHLVIVMNREDLVANMHDAYRRIDLQKEGYGVFIAGPSKTADIEQSLVIGAHGARSLTVVFVGEV